MRSLQKKSRLKITPALGLRIDILGVEHLVGAFEQLAHARAVQLQLQAAKAQRAEDDLAMTLDPLVGRLDALDAERRLRVAVGDQLDRRIILPVLLLEQRDADARRRRPRYGRP